MKNYFKILEINEAAADSEILQNYRRLAIKYHPDKNQKSLESAHTIMCDINEAYNILSDSNKKSEYLIRYYRYKSRSVKSKNNSNWDGSAEKYQADVYQKEYYFESGYSILGIFIGLGILLLDNVRKRASPQGNIQKWTSC